MSHPSFSVVAICRNEAKVLPRLFASLKEFLERGGSVYLCDTGSTDNSVELARSLGAKVTEAGDRFRKTITDEEAKNVNARFIVDGEEAILKEGDTLFQFDQARNYAASLATNDWVSFVDADEMFSSLNIDKIEEIIADPKLGLCEYSFVFSHDQFGNPAIQFRQAKMFRRSMFRWSGRIHELLVGEGGRTYLPPEVLKIEHYQNLETNREGYGRGLALDCYEFPANDRHSHYLARELHWSGRQKSALKEFERHISMNGWAAERGQSLVHMGQIYKHLGNDEKAVECWQKAFTVEPKRREALMRLASHYCQKGDAQSTACYAAAALEIPPSDFYANQNGHYTNEPHELLYGAKVALGDREGAKYHFDKAIAYQPYNPKYQFETQNFYEYGDPGIQGWMVNEELQFLYQLSKDNKTVIEVGSWKGRSTHALLSGGAKVTAVDHFQGSGEGDLTKDMAKQEDIYAVFMKNVGHFPNLTVMKMSNAEAVEKVELAEICFLDAGHSYEEVKKDIELWKPKALTVLCGHDYSDAWPGVKQAVDEMLGKPDAVFGSIWVKFL